MNHNCKLEHFEWVNVWHDHTNLTPEEEASSRRLLFIGDSITVSGIMTAFPKNTTQK